MFDQNYFLFSRPNYMKCRFDKTREKKIELLEKNFKNQKKGRGKEKYSNLKCNSVKRCEDVRLYIFPYTHIPDSSLLYTYIL